MKPCRPSLWISHWAPLGCSVGGKERGIAAPAGHSWAGRCPSTPGTVTPPVWSSWTSTCVASWISMVSCPFQVGHGTRVLNESIIVEWTVPKQLEVKYIGFSTGWGSMGEFKIWRKEETDENHNEAFTLGVPHNIIPGSERATASIIGINNQEVPLRYPLPNVNRCSSCYFWPVLE